MTELHDDVLAAHARIRDVVPFTPVEASRLGRRDETVYFKLENFLPTGSFKLRGACNRLATISDAVRAAGVVAASSGNHGLAVAYAARVRGCAATVYVPDYASAAKCASMRSLGAEVVVGGEDCLVAELRAREHAGRHGLFYVSPYNDRRVVAGQGTVAVELVRQLERIDTVYVAVGGGGLIAGIAGFLKVAAPGCEVVGCSPDRSAVVHESVRAGRIVDVPIRETLSDSTAGGLEPGSITFELCARLVDRWIDVDEAAIAAAMRAVIGSHAMLIEGAAGVAVGGYLADAPRAGRRAAVVICGRNVSTEQLARAMVL